MKVGYKDLTPLCSTCANICKQLVDTMARLHQRGSQVVGIEIRNGAPVSRGLSLPNFLSGIFALILAFCALSGVRAPAQNTDVDDFLFTPPRPPRIRSCQIPP